MRFANLRLGGRFAVDDDRTIPDTMQATFETPAGRLVVFGQYEANGNPTMAEPGFCELRGTQGTAYVNESTVQIVPERGGQFQDHRERMKPQMLKESGVATDKQGKANLSLTRSTPATSSTACVRGSCRIAMSRLVTARRLMPTWQTSRWLRGSASNGTPKPSTLSILTKQTACSPTSIASLGGWTIDRETLRRDPSLDNPPDGLVVAQARFFQRGNIAGIGRETRIGIDLQNPRAAGLVDAEIDPAYPHIPNSRQHSSDNRRKCSTRS